MNPKQQERRFGRRAWLRSLGAAGVGALAAPLVLPSGVRAAVSRHAVTPAVMLAAPFGVGRSSG